jgi:hypothetical protein
MTFFSRPLIRGGYSVEKQKEEREELIEAVKKLWEENKRSVTDGYKLPLDKYIFIV